jgi:hypothetical protein
MTDVDQELPPIPNEVNARIRGVLKAYRKQAERADARCRIAEKQQKFLAGKLVESKEREASTYNRLYDRLVEAIALSTQYRARIEQLERFACELDASGRKSTEPAALRGTPSDGEASASEGYLHTGARVQTEKAEG